jgi:hypothetical protein
LSGFGVGLGSPVLLGWFSCEVCDPLCSASTPAHDRLLRRAGGTTFGAVLELSAVFCAVVGAMRREAMFGPMLTHWDEAATYAVIGRLVTALS